MDDIEKCRKMIDLQIAINQTLLDRLETLEKTISLLLEDGKNDNDN